MNTAWDIVTGRLASRLTVARLDPWTSELVGRLVENGAVAADSVASAGSDLLGAARAAYRQWVDTHPTDAAVVEAEGALEQLVAECTPVDSRDRERVAAARDWAALLLLERIDDYRMPLPSGLLRLVRPDVVPAGSLDSARHVADWWARRTAA